MVAANVPCPTRLPDLAHRLRWLGAAALLAAATALSAQTTPPTALHAAPAGPSFAFELITAAEARRDLEARPKNEALDMPELRSRGMPAAAGTAEVPAAFAIRVLAPTPQEVVTAPLRIELAFDVPPGTRVKPSTFRVLYGVLKIDLTERLRRFATISERGVVVDQAVVPDGMHRLFLQVADDHGNVAERELRLRVGATS
ncbi:MAG: hypothetical protein KIT17_11770 [Rubrivivax sp.]|nr:hypothetical protein [Rubrivivax sp.]